MKGPLFDLSFVFLIIFLLPPVWPLISNKYMTFYIPEYSRRYIYLEGKFSYSLQLVLHKGNPAYSYWGTSPASNNNMTTTIHSQTSDPVEFIIKAPEYAYYGVMAVIQRLNFRTNPSKDGGGVGSDNNKNNGCRDYIQFSAEGGGGKGSSIAPSSKLCGTLSRGNTEWSPTNLLNGPRSYFNPKGSIKLRVHVDSTVLSSHQEEDQDLAELNSIGAEIVFTAYTSCPGTEVGLQTLRPCTTKMSNNNDNNNQPPSLACIPSSLFCDSKIDCGFSHDFGLDESSSCYFPYIYAGAAFLILLIILLLIYGFVHWVRIKSKRHQQQNLGDGPSTSHHGIEDQGGADPGMASMACDMDASMGAF